MANLSTRASDAAYRIFSGEAGLKVSVEAALAGQGLEVREADFVLEHRLWGTKLSDRGPDTRLPRVSLALTGMTSKGAEKLARSSAKATLEVEVAISGERPGDTQERLGNYVDAVLDLLDRNRGLWGQGVFYAGEFHMEVKPLAKGGLNFTQSAIFEVEIYLWQE